MDIPSDGRLHERLNGRCIMLVHSEAEGVAEEVEEVILRVQGFLLDLVLPPIRPHQYVLVSLCSVLYNQSEFCSIPHRAHRIIDMKQSVTLTGLGVAEFDAAVQGMGVVYQVFKTHLLQRNCQLRPWAPGRDGEDHTLTFSNRYLTSGKDAEGETMCDLGDVVDPLNVLRPLLKTEVHTADNQVEYWQRRILREEYVCMDT